jgi:hypothetical protein
LGHLCKTGDVDIFISKSEILNESTALMYLPIISTFLFSTPGKEHHSTVFEMEKRLF